MKGIREFIYEQLNESKVNETVVKDNNGKKIIIVGKPFTTDRDENYIAAIEYLKQNGKCKSSLISKMFGSNNVKTLLENQVLLVEENKINRMEIGEKKEKNIELTPLQKSCVNDISNQ